MPNIQARQHSFMKSRMLTHFENQGRREWDKVTSAIDGECCSRANEERSMPNAPAGVMGLATAQLHRSQARMPIIRKT